MPVQTAAVAYVAMRFAAVPAPPAPVGNVVQTREPAALHAVHLVRFAGEMASAVIKANSPAARRVAILATPAVPVAHRFPAVQLMKPAALLVRAALPAAVGLTTPSVALSARSTLAALLEKLAAPVVAADEEV